MRKALIVAAAALAAAGTAGCGSTKTPGGTGAAPAGGSTTAQGPAAADATFTYLDSNELMVGWDPATSYSNQGSVITSMYDHLFRYDKTAKQVKPQLADSYVKS